MNVKTVVFSVFAFAMGLGTGLFVNERVSGEPVDVDSVSQGDLAFNAFISDWSVLRFIETDRIDLAKKNLRISLEGNLVTALKHGTPMLDLHEPSGKAAQIQRYLEYWRAAEKVNYGEPDPINSVLEEAYLEYVQGDDGSGSDLPNLLKQHKKKPRMLL